MPCSDTENDFRPGDLETVILRKILSRLCTVTGGGGASVAYVDAGDAATLAAANAHSDAGDAATLATASGLYVLKAGDTMTGPLAFNRGVLVASSPSINAAATWNNAAVTFTSILYNVTNTASNSNSNLFNFQVDGEDRANFTVGGVARFVRHTADNSGLTLFLRKRGRTGDVDGSIIADGAIGSVSASGWDGAAYFTGASLQFFAEESWTGAAAGTRATFQLTTPTTQTNVNALILRTTSATFLGSVITPLLVLPATTSSSIGVITLGGDRFAHAWAAPASDGFNTFLGRLAGNFTMSPGGGAASLASYNTGVGYNALQANTTGSNNTALGYASLFSNTTGTRNSAVGYAALNSNTTGLANVAVGYYALYANTTGGASVAVGDTALASNTTGVQNSVVGFQALVYNTTGIANTAVGYDVGFNVASDIAQYRIIDDTSMTLIGAGATKDNAATLTNGTAIGAGAHVLASNQVVLGNTSVTTTLLNGKVGIGVTAPGSLLTLATAGALAFTSGANQRAGNATLVGGTITVNNTTVTANTIVILTRKTAGGTLGTAITYTVTAATSFTIDSDSVIDTSTFSYMLIEVP